MTMDLEKFQKDVEKLRKGGKRVRYPKAMKGFAVAYAKEQIAGGVSFNGCVQTLGISEGTLKRWLEVDGGGFRPVRMRKDRSPTAAGGVTLVTPDGFRLEGLPVKDAIGLLRALS